VPNMTKWLQGYIFSFLAMIYYVDIIFPHTHHLNPLVDFCLVKYHDSYKNLSKIGNN
jgi:hypothetical protein